MESQFLDTAHGKIHVLTCGPADGEAVLLLHGCPSDAWTWKILGSIAICIYSIDL